MARQVTNRSQLRCAPRPRGREPALTETEWRTAVRAELNRITRAADETINRLHGFFRDLCFAEIDPAKPKPYAVKQRRKQRAKTLRNAAKIVEDELHTSPWSTIELMPHVVGRLRDRDSRGRPILGPHPMAVSRIQQVAVSLRSLADHLEATTPQPLLPQLERSPRQNQQQARERFVARVLLLWSEIGDEPIATCAIGNSDQPAPFLSLLIAVSTPIKDWARPRGLSPRTLQRVAQDLCDRGRRFGEMYIERVSDR